MRPGFLVQRVYDTEEEKVYNIGSSELLRECPDLAKQVRASRSRLPWLLRMLLLQAVGSSFRKRRLSRSAGHLTPPSHPLDNLQVEGLVSRSLKELARLGAEEEEQDAQQGTRGKLQVCRL